MQDTDPQPPSSPATSPADWVRLQQCAGVGAVAVDTLLKELCSVPAIFAAPRSALARLVGPAAADALLAAPDAATLRQIDATLAWLDQPGHQLLGRTDAAYPQSLLRIHAPPVCLYVNGRGKLLSAPAFAIVGSRNATTQGKANAQAFARALSDAGLTIVSGMALGIDAAAHAGGLQGASSTVAVLGTGIDRVYPRRNLALARQIAEQGCLVSEFPLGFPVFKENFPRRNRIISGLAEGVLVVEAALESGSLVTADMAVEQNKSVYALPGSVHAPLSKGCHHLIREGAKLVDSVEHILQELQRPVAPQGALPAPGRALEPAWQALLDALGHDPVDPGVLAGQAGYEVGLLNSYLLSLELAGHVERLPGGRYQRVVPDAPPR